MRDLRGVDDHLAAGHGDHRLVDAAHHVHVFDVTLAASFALQATALEARGPIEELLLEPRVTREVQLLHAAQGAREHLGPEGARAHRRAAAAELLRISHAGPESAELAHRDEAGQLREHAADERGAGPAVAGDVQDARSIAQDVMAASTTTEARQTAERPRSGH
jgi:hypothetical protein